MWTMEKGEQNFLAKESESEHPPQRPDQAGLLESPQSGIISPSTQKAVLGSFHHVTTKSIQTVLAMISSMSYQEEATGGRRGGTPQEAEKLQFLMPPNLSQMGAPKTVTNKPLPTENILKETFLLINFL